MGGLLSRSPPTQSNETKTRWKRSKRKQLNKMSTIVEDNGFPNQNHLETIESNHNLVNPYEEWTKINEIQRVPPMINTDPPGAPLTYPTISNDPMSKSWSAAIDVDNSHPYQLTYNSNKFTPTQISARPPNQSQQIPIEDRPSKKVQFAQQQQQQQIPTRIPLTNTHSGHETSQINNAESIPSTKRDPTVNRPSANRSHTTNPQSTQISLQKPIYVGIDHNATKAEHRHVSAQKSHKKTHHDGVNSSSTSSNNSNTNRTRVRTHKQPEANDSPNPKVSAQLNKLENLQPSFSNPNRSLPTTLTSTVIPNQHAQRTERPTSNDNDLKSSKTRTNHHHHEQDLINNDGKSLKKKTTHSQQKQHRNNSPVRPEAIQRKENSHQSSPVMKIPISKQQQQQQQQRQKQTNPSSSMPISTVVTRTRV